MKKSLLNCFQTSACLSLLCMFIIQGCKKDDIQPENNASKATVPAMTSSKITNSLSNTDGVDVEWYWDGDGPGSPPLPPPPKP